MRNLELKIKRKSLAEEARMIRREELKLKSDGKGSSSQYNSLHEHRIGIVREASRYAHLAHTFNRGQSYHTAEAKGSKPFSQLRLRQEIERFNPLFAALEKSERDKLISKWSEGKVLPALAEAA